MKRTAGIFSRTKKGKKTWQARLVYFDETGKKRELQRRAEGRAQARDLAEQMAREYDESGGRARLGARMTFPQLVAYCEEHYYKPAEYRDERKVQGVRGLATVLSQLRVLKEYFGAKSLRAITYADGSTLRSHAVGPECGPRQHPRRPQYLSALGGEPCRLIIRPQHRD